MQIDLENIHEYGVIKIKKLKDMKWKKKHIFIILGNQVSIFSFETIIQKDDL